MSRATENTGFICDMCGAVVVPLQSGSYRNHCPFCLYSKHVDERPGDRAYPCRGLMEPVAVDYHAAKGYVIVHRCCRCGGVRRNRVADDARQGEDLDRVIDVITGR